MKKFGVKNIFALLFMLPALAVATGKFLYTGDSGQGTPGYADALGIQSALINFSGSPTQPSSPSGFLGDRWLYYSNGDSASSLHNLAIVGTQASAGVFSFKLRLNTDVANGDTRGGPMLWTVTGGPHVLEAAIKNTGAGSFIDGRSFSEETGSFATTGLTLGTTYDVKLTYSNLSFTVWVNGVAKVTSTTPPFTVAPDRLDVCDVSFLGSVPTDLYVDNVFYGDSAGDTPTQPTSTPTNSPTPVITSTFTPTNSPTLTASPTPSATPTVTMTPPVHEPVNVAGGGWTSNYGGTLLMTWNDAPASVTAWNFFVNGQFFDRAPREFTFLNGGGRRQYNLNPFSPTRLPAVIYVTAESPGAPYSPNSIAVTVTASQGGVTGSVYFDSFVFSGTGVSQDTYAMTSVSSVAGVLACYVTTYPGLTWVGAQTVVPNSVSATSFSTGTDSAAYINSGAIDVVATLNAGVNNYKAFFEYLH